jgi:hypothetical protein
MPCKSYGAPQASYAGRDHHEPEHDYHEPGPLQAANPQKTEECRGAKVSNYQGSFRQSSWKKGENYGGFSEC